MLTRVGYRRAYKLHHLQGDGFHHSRRVLPCLEPCAVFISRPPRGVQYSRSDRWDSARRPSSTVRPIAGRVNLALEAPGIRRFCFSTNLRQPELGFQADLRYLDGWVTQLRLMSDQVIHSGVYIDSLTGQLTLYVYRVAFDGSYWSMVKVPGNEDPSRLRVTSSRMFARPMNLLLVFQLIPKWLRT